MAVRDNLANRGNLNCYNAAWQSGAKIKPYNIDTLQYLCYNNCGGGQCENQRKTHQI